MKELLILSKFSKEKNGKQYYTLECVRLVHDSQKGNKIYRQYIDNRTCNYLVNVSKAEYESAQVGDIYGYTTTTNEYDKVEYVLGTLRKNIFGK